MSDVLRPELEEKYAQLWHETCSGQIPENLRPFISDGVLSSHEEHLYTEAALESLESYGGRRLT